MSAEPRAEPGEGGISRTVSTPSNTLVLFPHLHDHDQSVCLDLLTVVEPDDENVLAVSLDESAAVKSQRWSEHVGTPPRELVVVERTPSDSAASVGVTPDRESETALRPTVRSVPEDGDLASLAETISERLAEWGASDAQTVFCFQSLTPLLEQHDLRHVFRFLHLLLRRLESIDAVAHFHLDPDATDEQALYTLLSLFDTVVERDECGSIRVVDDTPE